MTDFIAARRAMIDQQIRVNDPGDPAILASMAIVPREDFVPTGLRGFAYTDNDLPLTAGTAPRYLIKPVVLSRLMAALALQQGARVLDIGAGAGYCAAVLAAAGMRVTALEADVSLFEFAREQLAERAEILLGPLAVGAPDNGPFDAILIEGSIEQVPPSLFAQLTDGGRLVAVLGAGRSGRVLVYRRFGDELVEQFIFDAAVPALPGFTVPKRFSL